MYVSSIMTDAPIFLQCARIWRISPVRIERKQAFQELSGWKNIKAYPSEANFILLRLLTETVSAAELFEIQGVICALQAKNTMSVFTMPPQTG